MVLGKIYLCFYNRFPCNGLGVIGALFQKGMDRLPCFGLCRQFCPMSKGRHVHPVGDAMGWVARIIAAGLIMVLPGLGGNWVDQRLGTHFVALLGFAVGIAWSLVYLLAITRTTTPNPTTRSKPEAKDSE